MSQQLDALQIGHQVEVRGPVVRAERRSISPSSFPPNTTSAHHPDPPHPAHTRQGSIEYKGRGVFRRNGAPLPAAERLALVAGGTGITPLYQVICRILTRASDNTKIALVYCNRTEEDILLRKELDGLQASRPNFKARGSGSLLCVCVWACEFGGPSRDEGAQRPLVLFCLLPRSASSFA